MPGAETVAPNTCRKSLFKSPPPLSKTLKIGMGPFSLRRGVKLPLEDGNPVAEGYMRNRESVLGEAGSAAKERIYNTTPGKHDGRACCMSNEAPNRLSAVPGVATSCYTESLLARSDPIINEVT